MKLSLVLSLFLLSTSALAQEALLAPNAPEDKPTRISGEEHVAFEKAIAPYVAKAKASYPAAKKKFQAGLPKGQHFFVTTRLRDSTGRYEQAFVAVLTIEKGQIEGRIWSDIALVKGYEHGDSYTFPESEIMDWLITHPDGSEEGNVVGNFLDTYRPQ
jgi:hypothetical protein